MSALHNRRSQHQREQGFTLVEMMIAVTIGLLIVSGLATLFVNNSRVQREIDRMNRKVENGRYAMQVMTGDIRNAAFYSDFDPAVLSAPAAKPDACATAVADLIAALPLGVQGYDQVAGTSIPSCIATDIKTGTDVIVVRHANTCVAGASNCDAIADGTPYFQSSRCNSATELGSASVSDYFVLSTSVANFTRTNRDCATRADLRQYLVHIYFIANNDVGSDQKPTLKRAELSLTGGAVQFTTVPIAEGIENLQIEYGIDTNSDGTPDSYTADPDSFGCAGACTGTVSVANWQNVMAVKLHLLARDLDITPGYSAAQKKYTLGYQADGSSNDFTFSDSYKRSVFETLVTLSNPIGRRT